MSRQLAFDDPLLRAGLERDLIDEILPLVIAEGETIIMKARQKKPPSIQGNSVVLFEAIFTAFRRHLRDLFGADRFDAEIGRILDSKSYRIVPGPPWRIEFEPAALKAFHAAVDAELGESLARDLAANVLEGVSAMYLAGREAATRRVGGVRRPVSPPDEPRSAVSILQKQTLFWIGHAYSDTLSHSINKAIEVVVKRGLAPDAGRDALKAELGDAFSRTDAYWYMLAHAAMGRASNFGALSRLREAQVTSFEFVSVLDEVTSPICRYMNGRVFRVSKAAEIMDEVLQASDPRTIRTKQPWLRFDRRRALDGLDAIWFRSTEDGLPPDDPADDFRMRQYLPHSRFRLVGDQFQPTALPNDKAVNLTLEQLGYVTPPLHGRCRSDLVISSQAVDDYIGR